jgi:hypothetical protein
MFSTYSVVINTDSYITLHSTDISHNKYRQTDAPSTNTKTTQTNNQHTSQNYHINTNTTQYTTRKYITSHHNTLTHKHTDACYSHPIPISPILVIIAIREE